MMDKPKQIAVIDLMPKLDKLLIDLLEGLSLADWNKQTIAPNWKVKDIAVHLLDGNLRTLSMLRDGYYGEQAIGINTYTDLVSYLNQLNADIQAHISIFIKIQNKIFIHAQSLKKFKHIII